MGVIGAITPFNHPMNQVAHKVVPAIATNDRMSVQALGKGAPSRRYLSRRRALRSRLAARRCCKCDRRPARNRRRTDHPPARRSDYFTGGVAIGKYIAAKAAYRRVVLELGGNDPLIVLEDADLDEAATLAVQGSY